MPIRKFVAGAAQSVSVADIQLKRMLLAPDTVVAISAGGVTALIPATCAALGSSLPVELSDGGVAFGGAQLPGPVTITVTGAGSVVLFW